MTFTHELSDFASRLRVAYIAKDLAVAVRLTRLTLELSGLFYRQGFIQSFSIQNSRKILIRLKYSNNRPLLKKITVISTPGRRVYWNLATLSSYYNSHALNGFYILSTPVGLRTGSDCLLIDHQGGEVLMKIELG